MKWTVAERKVPIRSRLVQGFAGVKRASHSRILTIAWWSAAACFTWLSIIHLPRDVVSPRLDPSYQAALSYFAEKHLQFGPEVMFTYGPVGYLMPEIYEGTYFGRKLICELLSKLIITAVIIWIARRLPVLRRVLFLLFVWISASCLGSSSPEVLVYLSLAGTGAILSSDNRRHYFVGSLLVFLAFMSLIKFTLLVYCSSVVVFVTLYWAFKRNWKMSVLIPSAYTALLLLTWTMAGQKLVNFSTWIVASLQVASGYQQCMGVDPAPGIWPLAIAVASIAISLIGVSFYNHRRSLLPWFPLLALTAGYWLSWKHGLVRADDHVRIFFGFSLVGFICLPVFVRRESSRVRLRRYLSAAGGLLCLAGIYVENANLLEEGPAYSLSHVVATTRGLIFLSSYEADMTAMLSLRKQQFDCPHIKAEVGQSTVDVFGSDQGIAMLNDLNYHPRPAFQSYSAYTPFLIRANAEFYRSEAAPTFVISRLFTIDDRFPTLDDSEALRVLLLDYELVLEEHGYLLWRRLAHRTTASEEVSEPETREITFGQAVRLSEGNVWCVMDIKESILGKIRSFLYKPPILSIYVTDKDGRGVMYRILPSITRHGFILDPYLQSQADIIGLKSTFAPKPGPVVSFTLVTDDSSRKYFDSHVKIQLARLGL